MVSISVPIEDDIFSTLAMDEGEIAAIMRREAAFRLFKDGELTLRQGADMCGVSFREFMRLLSNAGIPVIDYTAEEVAAEVSSLRAALFC